MTERKQSAEYQALSHILLMDTAQKTATRLESLGFDAQRTIEKLPEIMEALEDCIDWMKFREKIIPGQPNITNNAHTLLTACREDFSND